MAERFKAPVLKTGVGASSPWVRIPLPPPDVTSALSPSADVDGCIRLEIAPASAVVRGRSGPRGRGGSVRGTIDVVTAPSVAMRPAVGSSAPEACATILITKQSSRATRWTSIMSGMAAKRARFFLMCACVVRSLMTATMSMPSTFWWISAPWPGMTPPASSRLWSGAPAPAAAALSERVFEILLPDPTLEEAGGPESRRQTTMSPIISNSTWDSMRSAPRRPDTWQSDCPPLWPWPAG
jgi:hypothetical protein